MSLFTKLFGNRESKNKSKLEQPKFLKMNKSVVNDFQDLLEQNAGLSFEKQLLFGDLIGSNSWQLVLDKGQISFGDLNFPIQVIGSLSFNDSSWMWGWANSRSGIPENLLIQSNKLKEIGQEKDIEELTNPHFSVEQGFEHKIGLIACGIFETDSYYCANYGQGTLVVTINDKRNTQVNDQMPEKVLTAFPQLIGSIKVDHKNALKNYLIDRQFEISISENLIEGLKNDFSIRGEFDQQVLTSLRAVT